MSNPNITTLTIALVKAIKAGTFTVGEFLSTTEMRVQFAADGIGQLTDDDIFEAVDMAQNSVRKMADEAAPAVMTYTQTLDALESSFAIVKRAADLDELVQLLGAFVDEVRELDVEGDMLNQYMGKMDLPGLPSWGDGKSLDAHGAWSWDERRVMYLGEDFSPRLEDRRDLDDDSDADEVEPSGPQRVGVPTSHEYMGCLYGTGREAAKEAILDFFTACGSNDASEALDVMWSAGCWLEWDMYDGIDMDQRGEAVRVELINAAAWTMPANSDNRDVGHAWDDAVRELEDRILFLGEDNLNLADEVRGRRAKMIQLGHHE